MADFLTEDEITEFFTLVDSTFTIADVPPFVRSAAYQEILERSDFDWEEKVQTIYEDGRGTKEVFCPVLPIIALTEVVIVSQTLGETSLNVDQTDDDRQIWYDAATGKIEIIQPIGGIEVAGADNATASVFPTGVQNIKLVGTFGQDSPSSILSLLQLYLMLRNMARTDPAKWGKGDIVSEKIGKYQYELYGRGSTQSHRQSLDQYIDYLFSVLPSNNTFFYDNV